MGVIPPKLESMVSHYKAL